MYIKKLILLMAIFLMALPNCFSQQFTYPWNFYDSTGAIQDMHFMPGDSEFIYTTDGNMIRVRSTLTADLKREWPGVQGKFEFTADSKKIVLINGPKIELRKLSDMSLVASDSLELGADSVDGGGNKITINFNALAVDPVRPFAYVVIEKSNNTNYPTFIDTNMIVVYNLETMKQVTGLIKKANQELYYKPVLAVSRDGKYLASINNNQCYLKVWELPSLKLVRNFPLFDTVNYYLDKSRYACRAIDLKFSETYLNKIYFTGTYPKDHWSLSGLGIFSLEANAIIDTTFGRIGDGYITLFDNEQRVLFLSYSKIVLNLDQKIIEYKKDMFDPYYAAWSVPVYSSKYDIFVGFDYNYCSSGIYDRNTSAQEDSKEVNVLFPNPTSSLVTIEISCSQPTVNYQISKSNGEIIVNSSTENTNNSVKIDFSTYPNGVYFLTLICGNTNTTYKIIKEG